MANTNLSQSFVGTDVEAAAPTKIIEVGTFFRRSDSAAAKRAMQKKLDAAVMEAYKLIAPKVVLTKDGYEPFACKGCGRTAHRRPGVARTHCRPCEKGKS